MFIEPTQEQGAAFFTNPPAGPVVMLNLLRFRDVADYSRSPDLAPDHAISGADAYNRYAKHALPFIEEAGARVLFDGQGHAMFIGPTDETWHRVLLVEHRSAEAFLGFARNKAYLAGIGHRTAALADSRLLPMSARTS